MVKSLGESPEELLLPTIFYIFIGTTHGGFPVVKLLGESKMIFYLQYLLV